MSRKALRNAAVASLTGLSLTGANVFPYRLHRLGVAQMPALRVYLGEEELSEDMQIMGDSVRTLDLIVEVVAAQVADLDDKLDDVQAQVETALNANPTLGGQAIDSEYQSTEAPELSGEGETPVGIQRIHYRVIYE